MKQINAFKSRARSQILAEKVALSKAWTEELIARAAESDGEFKRFRIATLRETMLTARDMLDKDQAELRSRISALNLALMDVEKSLAIRNAGDVVVLSVKEYVEVLYSIKELIFELDSARGILAEEVHDGSN